MIYVHRVTLGKHRKLAEKWLRKAAKNGNKDALSLFEE